MDIATIAQELEALRSEVTELRAEVARLHAKAPAKPAKPKAEVTDDIAMVIAAAVSAFMGHKARIKTIRHYEDALATEGWRVQGRVAVQASHRMPARTSH